MPGRAFRFLLRLWFFVRVVQKFRAPQFFQRFLVITVAGLDYGQELHHFRHGAFRRDFTFCHSRHHVHFLFPEAVSGVSVHPHRHYGLYVARTGQEWRDWLDSLRKRALMTLKHYQDARRREVRIPAVQMTLFE